MANSLNLQQAALQLNDTIATTGVFPSVDYTGKSAGMTLGMHHVYAFSIPGGMSYLLPTAGQFLPIGQNAALFSLLGVSYGGNGTTNFELPNTTLKTSVGAGQGTGLPSHVISETFGTASATLSTSVLPPAMGGAAQSLNDAGPQLTERYMIAVNGVYPPIGGGGGSLDFIGSIVKAAFTFETNEYMECDGRALLISQHSALFTVIGFQYGGNGQTTFNLPDLRGRTLVGAGGNHAVGDYFGTDTLAITNANLPTNMGGNGVALPNEEPSLAINYCIATEGIFPSDRSGSSADMPIVGEIIAFAGNFAPGSFLPCNGQLLSIAQYETLFALLGTIYGGDGVNTFALPDLRDRAIVGMSSPATLGQTVGSNQINLTSADFPNLNYSGSDAAGNHYGADGNDIIFGLGGDDHLFGLGGSDTLDGGAGADVLDGGGGNDTAYYYGSNLGVTVNLASGTGFGGDAQGDTYTGIEYVVGSNNAGDNLVGDNGVNYLNGMGGDDVIDGGGVAVPSTTKQGDSLDGGAGTDTLSYASSGFGTVVLMSYTSATAGIAWNGTSGDVMINFENFKGSNFHDVVQGTNAANVINGGGGSDSMYGFGGADTFRFDHFDTDVIADFQDNSDKISISTAIATDFSKLTIYGNGTHIMSVVLADNSQIIVQGDGVTNITLTASDFLFV